MPKNWRQGKGKGPVIEFVLKTLSDGLVHYPEHMAEAYYGEDSLNNIVGIRMAISRLRKIGYVIEATGVLDTKQKHGYRFADTRANWERGVSNGTEHTGERMAASPERAVTLPHAG